MSSDAEDFEIDTSSGNLTFPAACSTMRKNGHVVIKGRPCKIMEMSESKTGKHGHTKIHLVGLDIFTGRKYEDISPSTYEVDVPFVHRTEYNLDGTENGYLLLTDHDGNSKNDVAVPEGDLGYQLADSLSNGDRLTVTIISTMNEEACIAVKVDV
ncbi:hypothetical protein N7478_012387 [Penicillium angulare]|uniref:uncharacterized protein n=1 Tax=Penicillium angulare TaxID=116970 RepID=UPI00254202A0|nr:uncharacterized protein N7478_012387 [Penicillium angulare]KAJ5259406.1 hypothetical protein N7478_012387 [Penicillium angulare]